MAALGTRLAPATPRAFAALQERVAQHGLTLQAAEVADPAPALAAGRGAPRLVARCPAAPSPWAGPEGKRRVATLRARGLMAVARLEGVVVPLPACDHAATAVRRRAVELIPEGAARLFLENRPVPSGAPGHRHFRDPAHFIELLLGVREAVDPTLERVGLCLNLAHLLASGADVGTPEKLRAWLDEVLRVAALPPDGLVFDLRGTKSPAAAEALRRAAAAGGIVLVDADARSLGWLEGLAPD